MPGCFGLLPLRSVFQRNSSHSHLTPTTGATYQLLNRYDVDLEFFGAVNQRLVLLEDFPVLEAPLSAQGIEGLIGRDVLSRCLFVYDGNANTFSLFF